MRGIIMELGAFSISLSVKNLEESRQFYEKLGFEVVGGEQFQNYLIVRNGDNTIGLFQGMFEGNILTFNPGWDKACKALESYSDIREIHKKFSSEGIDISNESITSETGPSSFSVIDPDGNSILIDQHI